MAKMDTNLDACRLSSEILLRLRKILREALNSLYGKNWEEAGIPAEIRDFLIQRQAREASINWNLSDTIDVLDFAGFLNLYEVIAANEFLVQRFLPLAPDPSVLRIRFLELDTILNRIAYARPISEGDLGFLVSFDERLRKTSTAAATPDEVAAAKARPPKVPAPPPPAVEIPTPPPPKPAAPAPKPVAQETKRAPAPPPPPPPKPEPAPEPAVEADAEAPPAAQEFGPKELEAALKRGDDRTILAALYREVTALADGLWNGAIQSQQAKTWEKARESQWYHDRFGKLGLKPISDFFGLFETAKEKTLAGTSKNDLQEFLKEHNFVQVLLALKSLFKAQKA
jgi:hypothetical protein